MLVRASIGLFVLAAACGGSQADTPDAALPVDAAGPPDAAAPWAHVARVTVPASFAPQTDGSYSLADGSELYDVGIAFYAEHPDVYDMLIVWTDFVVNDLFAFAVPLDHDIQGIGLQEVMALYGWDTLTPQVAGSDGALQHIVLMNHRSLYGPTARYPAQDILTHEVGHRWSADLSLPWATDRWVLVDAFWSHWNVFAGIGGASALGYGELVDLGGGEFSFEIRSPFRYAQLELYQQGLIAPAEVGPLFYVEGATAFDPPTYFGGPWTNDSYGQAVRYAGTRVPFTIDEVIAAHGPRIPDHTQAQRDFRTAFVLVCVDAAACTTESLAFVDGERAAWETTFPDATGGRATVDTRLDP